MKKIVDFAHDLLLEVKHAKVAVDFTLGNGHDLKFMEQINSIEVLYGFDIQEEAIEASKNNITSHKEIHYILDSHEFFDQYVTNYDLGIFNLGYYPSGDQKITTKCDSSIKAIEKAIQKLNKKGMLVVVVYPGHEEGKKEANGIDEMMKQLDAHYFSIVSIKMITSDKAPYIYGIQKVR